MKKTICFVIVIILLCVGIGVSQFRRNTLTKIIKEQETKIMTLTELAGITAGIKIATEESLIARQKSFLDNMFFHQKKEGELGQKINTEVKICKKMLEKKNEATSLETIMYYLGENLESAQKVDTLKHQMFDRRLKKEKDYVEYIRFLENELTKLLGQQTAFQPCLTDYSE